MFLLRQSQQPQYYSCPSNSFGSNINELCLLDQFQKEYLYKKQQIEKRQIQRLNQPEIQFDQDCDNYYILLNKNINRGNYQFINKFDGYSLKQIENYSLIIKSSRDNFFKNIKLPSNIDINDNINYKLLNNGYSMIISIPKIKNIQIKQSSIMENNFEFPDIFSNLRLLNGNSINLNNTPRKIRIPIDDDEEHHDVEINRQHDDVETKLNEQEQEQEKEVEEEVNEKPEPEQEQEFIEEEQKEEMEVEEEPEQSIDLRNIPGPTNFLKNYSTTERKTVFLPDTLTDDEDMESDNSIEDEKDEEEDTCKEINIRRLHSPTLEVVVDKEFL